MDGERRGMTLKQMLRISLAIGVGTFVLAFTSMFLLGRLWGPALLFGAGTGFLFALGTFIGCYLGK